MASFALRNVAPASTVTAYSLSQQMICMAWNITFGLVFMASTFGWSATKDMVRGLEGEAIAERPREAG